MHESYLVSVTYHGRVGSFKLFFLYRFVSNSGLVLRSGLCRHAVPANTAHRTPYASEILVHKEQEVGRSAVVGQIFLQAIDNCALREAELLHSFNNTHV